MGELVAGDQVAAAQLNAIDAETLRRNVDEPLHDRGRFRPPGAAKRRGGHRVGHDAAQANAGERHIVNGRRHAIAVAQRHIGDGMGADIGGELERERQHAAAAVECEPRGGDEVARGVVGEEGLVAVGRPSHRPVEATRRPAHHERDQVAGQRDVDGERLVDQAEPQRGGGDHRGGTEHARGERAHAVTAIRSGETTPTERTVAAPTSSW